MMLLELMVSFIQVGLFSVGGGYAALPLIQNQVVTLHGWLTLSEFTDLVTIAEMTPGPIAINAATFVGIRIMGPLGAVAATLGCILPSCILVSLLALLYRRYGKLDTLQQVLASLRPAVVGLIASAAAGMLLQAVFLGKAAAPENLHWLGIGLMIAAFYLLRRHKWNPIAVMVLCGSVNLLLGLVMG